MPVGHTVIVTVVLVVDGGPNDGQTVKDSSGNDQTDGFTFTVK